MPEDLTQMTWLLEKSYELGTSMLVAALILLVGWMIAKRVEAGIRKGGQLRDVDVALVSFIAQIGRYTVLAIAVISALGRVGIQTTSIMAVFASAGLAVGLALQGSLSNFASGVMILFFRPFNVGDVCTVAGETGQVTEIGLFTTTLVNPSNHKIIIANSAVTGGNIINYTTLGVRRTTVEFGVEYGADIRQVCEIVHAAALSCPTVLREPAEPVVAFVDMGASSLNFACHSWSASGDWLDCMHQVRTAIYDALNANGIEIPFNQIVVHNADAA